MFFQRHPLPTDSELSFFQPAVCHLFFHSRELLFLGDCDADWVDWVGCGGGHCRSVSSPRYGRRIGATRVGLLSGPVLSANSKLRTEISRNCVCVTLPDRRRKSFRIVASRRSVPKMKINRHCVLARPDSPGLKHI